MENEERLQILEMIERGTISAEQGIQLLNAINGGPQELPQTASAPEPEPLPAFESAAEEPSAKEAPPAASPASPNVNRWRNWWQIPLWVGVIITVGSALLMYLAYTAAAAANGNYFWFACTWFPFLMGVALLALAATSRSARWLHVRITQAPGETPQHINISMPIPLRLAAWFMRTFRHRIHGLDQVPDVDGLLEALRKTTPDEPFYVVVNDEEDGERVEVYIG